MGMIYFRQISLHACKKYIKFCYLTPLSKLFKEFLLSDKYFQQLFDAIISICELDAPLI
jgi:hypothetical protein